MAESPIDPKRRSCLKGLALLGALPALPLPVRSATASMTDLTYTLEPLRQKFDLPALAAAVCRGGTVVAATATGVRVQGSDIKVTVDDRFHLGSDTKAMTATLCGMAVEENRLRWASTLGEVLAPDVPGLNPKLAAVTLEQLLSHSGGAPTDSEQLQTVYFNADTFSYNLPELRLRALRAIKSQPPISPPGKQFHYSNMGYVIAGAMLEKVTGVSWEEYITRRLFEPLHLTSAGLGPQTTTGRIDAPVGHRVADDGTVTPMLWSTPADNPPMLGPAGVVHMSVVDFATWAGWNAGRGRRPPALVTPETLARIHRPHVNTGKLPNPRPGTPGEGKYALGWGIAKLSWARRPLLLHNGSNQMNLAKIVIDTQQDLGLVALTNFPGTKAEDALEAVAENLYKQFARH